MLNYLTEIEKKNNVLLENLKQYKVIHRKKILFMSSMRLRNRTTS